MHKRGIFLKVKSSILVVGFLPTIVSCHNQPQPQPQPVKKITVSFDCYGGYFEDDFREIEVDINSTWSKIKNLAPKCKEFSDTVFEGWYFFSDDGSVIRIEPETYFDENITIFALFVSKYKQISGPEICEKFCPNDTSIISGFGKFQAKIGPFIPSNDQNYNELTEWSIAAHSTNINNISCKTETINVEGQQQIYAVVSGQMIDCNNGQHNADISLFFYNLHSSFIPIRKKVTIRYEYKTFNWKKFLTPDTFSVVESDWEILISALNGGYTAEDIISNIEVTTKEKFSWDNEYVARIKVNNGKLHKVRLIGLERDIVQGAKNHAIMTWEFKNVVLRGVDSSDNAALTTNWNSNSSADSSNYYESTINQCLNSDENVSWKTSTSTTTWEGPSILYMLPSIVKNAIVSVEKRINTWNGNWSHQQSQPVKLFVPTLANFFDEDTIKEHFGEACIGEGGMFDDNSAQYPFYKNHIKSYSESRDMLKRVNPSSSESSDGYAYWFASPVINDDHNSAYWCNQVGEIVGSASSSITNQHEFSLAPCFCLGGNI